LFHVLRELILGQLAVGDPLLLGPLRRLLLAHPHGVDADIVLPLAHAVEHHGRVKLLLPTTTLAARKSPLAAAPVWPTEPALAALAALLRAPRGRRLQQQHQRGEGEKREGAE